MRFRFTPEQEALRDEIREYFGRVITPEIRRSFQNREFGPVYKAFVRQLGADGWLGVGWPKEYGGRGFTPFEQAMFFDECLQAGGRLPLVTINTVGPTLLSLGTPSQREFFLPRILRGEIEFAIGYTEPSAGTDLASLVTRAEPDGAGGFVINGTKVFTSGAADADYVWLAARTDPDAPKHKGITLFIVPTSSGGFSATRIRTMAGPHTYVTYYSDVRVGRDAIVGSLNEGWRIITTQLNHERAALGGFAPAHRILDDVAGWARSTGAIDQGWVRSALAQVDAYLEAFTLLNRRVAWAATAGTLNPADASAVKVYGTEINQEVSRLLLQVLGAAGSEVGDDAPLAGALDHATRMAIINTFGGGANEVQREIIATAALGLPRTGR